MHEGTQVLVSLKAKWELGQVRTHFWLVGSAKRSGKSGQIYTQLAVESSAKREVLKVQSGMQILAVRSAHSPGGHSSTQTLVVL